MSDRPAAAPLIGRENDLAKLTTALRSVQGGRMAAVVLSGEAGVGKTRIVQELMSQAARDGATVLCGGGIDIVESPPFWPVASALRNLLRSPAGKVAAERGASWVAQLDDLLAPGAQTAEPAGPHQRVQTLELIHRVILELAEDSVVVLVVEDLQWADRSTRDLLAYLIANLTHEPVLLVATHRSEAEADGSPVRAMLAELQRHRRVRCEVVAPLGHDAVARIVGMAAPGRPDLVDLVWQRSAGNAFIVEETLRAALDGDPLALPQTLRDLVLSRLAALSPAAQRVVRAVAVSDGPLSHPLLAAVVDQGEPELLDALRESVDHGVVMVDAGGDGYRLRHGLMTDVVSRDLLPGERIHLHRRYAAALENAWARDLPGIDARLAHHWQQAGDTERALAATVAAAEAADRVRGYAEAHRHWLRAAQLAGRVQPAEVAVPRGVCLERAAEAAHLAGDHDQAVALLSERLADPGETDGLTGALLHARTGQYLVAAGRGAEAAHAFSRATALLPARGAERERAEVLSGHAAALLHAGEFTASRTVAERALALAREVGLASEEARVLANLGFSLAYLEDPAAGSAALVEALAVAERASIPPDIGRAYLNLVELLSGPLNELERGVEVARDGIERVRQLGLARSAGVGLLSLVANGLFRLGRWDEAETAIEQAWELAPSGAEALGLRLSRCRLSIGRGRFDEAEDDLEAVEVLSTSTAGPRYRIPLLTLRAGLQMWLGRPDLALDHVGAGLDLVEHGSDDVWLVAPLVWHGARARAELTRLGMRRAEAAVTARLHRHAGELSRRAGRSVPAIRDVVLGFVEMCAAEDTRADGRSNPDRWARVAEIWERQQQPYPTAYARLRRAEALFALRARSAAGTQELRRAESAARAMDATPFLAEITELAERARVSLAGPPADECHDGPVAPVPEPRPPVPGDDDLGALTSRELEVLTELACGLTNREIAQRLFISEKTVGVHVSRIYAKIGVHSRVQASTVLYRARPDLRGHGQREAGRRR
ncbi:ATP-binding protein [Pseudonocardia bannensis]|uniref:AAA family ATPase n=1 Tax=Pseudonocardia bannensis TaxID=630973 RepID=A0A848DKV1_9PSEU|nr:LuxR family transcriptional regulator [Pseudonocardia bannensis]NMH93091.1 AAA family ATPase [Pseudonocardia bannensis]